MDMQLVLNVTIVIFGNSINPAEYMQELDELKKQRTVKLEIEEFPDYVEWHFCVKIMYICFSLVTGSIASCA